MIAPNIKELLSDLPNTSHGKALNVFLEEKYEEIGNIMSIPNDKNTAIETLGRQFALKLLEELFGFMGKKKTETKKRNQYE